LLRYIALRLLWTIPTLLGISFVTFALLHLVPGDAASVRYSGGEGAGDPAGAQAAIASFRAEHLFDRTLAIQYLHYLGPFNLGPDGARWLGGTGERPWHGLLALDFGREYLRPQIAVADELWSRLGVTLPIALAAVLLSYLLALPIGIYAAMRRGGAFDVGSAFVLLVLYALPAFWVGLLLQLAFGRAGLGWLPVIGWSEVAPNASLATRALDVARHAVLPVACLTYGGLAYVSRQMRSSLLEALGQDYVRTARSKGLPERTVVLRHALRNALIPVATLFGKTLPVLVGGSILIETVFDLPGVGKYAYEGLLLREYNVVTACVLLSALMTVLGYLLSDLLYAWIDPRIRVGARDA
jgi:peptide/nickel transport system permease protein